MCKRSAKTSSAAFLVDADVLPQTIAVLRTRAEPIGIDVRVADLSAGLPDERVLRGAAAVPRRQRPGSRLRSDDRGGA